VVEFAELTVLVAIGVLVLVLLPEECEGDVLATEFAVDPASIGHGSLWPVVLPRDEEPRFKGHIVEVLG